jgi:hypothetical protein
MRSYRIPVGLLTLILCGASLATPRAIAQNNPNRIALLLKWYGANRDTTFAVAFDGANIWVGNQGSGTVSKL